jgi:hypothetical protein
VIDCLSLAGPYNNFIVERYSNFSLSARISVAPENANSNAPTPPSDPNRAWVDWIGGAAFGSLVGILVGLSATPVVSVVVTGIVALLAGLFGLSEKVAPGIPTAASRRLAAFGIAAVLVLPLALVARSRELLGPSIASQRESLIQMGFTDSVELRSMLAYLRFGLLPAGTVKPGDPQAAAALRPVFYAESTGTCDRLMRATTPEDRLQALEAGTEKSRTLAHVIRGLPELRQSAALEPASIYLCSVP